MITEAQVAEFETLQGRVESLYTEVLALSKKSSGDAFNAFKLKMANHILRAANKFLRAAERPFPVEEFEVFDDGALPTNSDVVLVLAQYLNALEQFRSANIR